MDPRRVFPALIAFAVSASTVPDARAYGGGHGGGHGGGRGGGSHAAAAAHGAWSGHGTWNGHGPHHHRFFGGFAGFWADPWPWPDYAYADPWYADNPWYGGIAPLPGVYPPPPDGMTPDSGGPAPTPSGIYWCPGSKGYYPYVRACPSGWQRVGEAPVASAPIAAPPGSASPVSPATDPPGTSRLPPTTSDPAEKP